MINVIAPILAFVGFTSIIVLICVIHSKAKLKRSSCPKCKKIYTYPDDFKVFAGDLKWERKTKEEWKGDFKYEIEYRVYYRYVGLDFKCSKCGHSHSLVKRIDVYRSDSNHSQSEAEEISLIKSKLRSMLEPSVFAGKNIKIIGLEE